MGLDMYLYKHTYIDNWENDPPEKKVTVKITIGKIEYKDIDSKTISHIVSEVGYWRKFNALHNWFIENCGNGDDNCRDIYVPKSKLEELRTILSEVKELLKEKYYTYNEQNERECEYLNSDKIKEIFPPSPGFFFGSQEIDTYYENNVINTLTLLDEILEPKISNPQLNCDFYYRSSW